MQFSIYHTNDIHSNYDALRCIYTWLAQHREPDDLFLDSGDYADLKDVIVQSDKGPAASQLILSCGLDAMTIGNGEEDLGNEGITAMAQAGIPFICSNVTDNNGKPLAGIAGSRIFERGGKRFLIVGAAPYYNEHLSPNGYNVFTAMNNLLTQEPVAFLRADLDRRSGQYDYCILLSHSGLAVEQHLMKQLPEIDLCLGGHSHTVCAEGNYNQTGKSEFLGKVVIEIADDGDIRILENQLIPLESVEGTETAGFDALLSEKQTFADSVLASELPTAGELAFEPFTESPLTNFICDCLKDHCDTDLAIMHAGISEGPLVRPVSRKSLIENFPSKLNPTTITVTGRQILDAVALSFNADHIRGDGRGPGFRGHVLGTLGFSSNVRIVHHDIPGDFDKLSHPNFSSSRPDCSSSHSEPQHRTPEPVEGSVPHYPFTMTINGSPVDPDATYRLATDDYLQRGSGYPSLKVPNDQATFDIWFIRDLVQHYLMNAELFARAKEKRIV